MATRKSMGGVIHTYQQYDPQRFPSPTEPPPDLVSSAFEHMLMFGERRELTEEELARAVRIDPSQIQGLGPSIDALQPCHQPASYWTTLARRNYCVLNSVPPSRKFEHWIDTILAGSMEFTAVLTKDAH